MGIFDIIRAIFNIEKASSEPMSEATTKAEHTVSETPVSNISSNRWLRDIETEFSQYKEPYFQFDIDKMNFDQKEDIEIRSEREKTLLAFLINRNAETPGIAKYWTLEFNTNFNEVIQRFISGGYFEIREDLDLEFTKFKVDELKVLLKTNNFHVSGRRQELIDRLKTNLSEDVLYDFFGGRHKFFIGTPKAQQVQADYKAGLLNSHPVAVYNWQEMRNSAKKELRSYADSGVLKYQILGALNNSPCEKCKEMNGKIIPVSKGVIGKNFPPFCGKCLCTTVAIFDD